MYSPVRLRADDASPASTFFINTWLPAPVSTGGVSVGRAAQLRRVFRFRRLGFDRLDRAVLDWRCLDTHGSRGPRRIGRAGLVLRRMQHTRPGHRPRQQHLGGALMTEVAIGEAHAGDRTTEVALILLVEIEARLERKALDRGADGLAADLKRIAGKAHVAHRTGTAELYGAHGATVIEHTACAAGAVEAGKREHLAGDKFAGFFAIHDLSGEGGRHHRTGRQRTQHKTRKHAKLQLTEQGQPLDIFTRCLPYQPWQHWSSLVGKV